nr:hypothetical protein [Tanacetum cinerariifolium]
MMGRVGPTTISPTPNPNHPICRDIVQLETAISTISQEYLLEFASEYGISEDLHPKLPGPEERIMDFPEGKVDERVFPTVADWRTSAPKDEMPAKDTYYAEAVTLVNTHHTSIQKQPEALLCLVRLSRRYFLGDDVYLTFLHDDNREMEDPATATDSSRVPSTIERSPLNFANENPSQQSTRGNETEDQGQETMAPEVSPPENVTTTRVAPEAGLAKEIAAMGPCVIKECRKRGNDRVDTNAPPKVLRKDHVDSRPTQSTVGGKSLTAMGLGMGSTFPVPTSQETPVDEVAIVGDPKSENTYFTSMVGSPESIYQPEWGMTNSCCLDAPEACQDLVDHIAPPEYFSELRHLHNDDFLKQYNINLARQVVIGSQLRLRFKQEAKLLKKSVAQVARKDQRIQARENKIKNLEALLEAETDMKRPRRPRTQNLARSWKTSALCFRPPKKRCAKMDAHLDALSIDFDEELYPHMLTAIAGMSEGLEYEVEHGKANLDLEAIDAYDPESETKYVTALNALRDLKYPMVDQLKLLKDAPIDVVMASLHLECDYEEDAPQWMPLRPTSDGVPVSVPTVAPQGLAILLVDAATQTETSKDGASLRILSISLDVRNDNVCNVLFTGRICTGSVSCAPWESSPRSCRSSSKSRFSRSSSSLCITSTATVRYVGVPISAGHLSWETEATHNVIPYEFLHLTVSDCRHGFCFYPFHKKGYGAVIENMGAAKGTQETFCKSTVGGKSLAAMGLGMGSTFPVPTSQETPVDVSDPDPLSFSNPQSIPTENVAQSSKEATVAGDLESENTSFTSMVGSPNSIYQPEWGVTHGCCLDVPEACQDLVDHIAPPGYFSELRHLHNDDFLKQYNIKLARKVAMGSQLRLRFEQEAKLLKKFVAQVARQDHRIQARENKIKNLEALLEAETDMKRPRRPRTQNLARVALGGYEVWGIDKAEAVFANVVSAGIAKGMSEGLKYGVEHGKANLDLKAIEAYDPESETKYVAALHAIRDLKYHMVDQLELLKDAPIDVVFAPLHLESDSKKDAPQRIREFHPSSSQLKIPVYPEVRDPKDPWDFKKEIQLADAIAANVSRAEKKKKCRVVCRTHGVSFAHHARSDGVPVSVPTVALQGLAILLADATTQTETSEDGASPRICTGSVSCAPWESSRMHLTS